MKQLFNTTCRNQNLIAYNRRPHRPFRSLKADFQFVNRIMVTIVVAVIR